MTTLSDLQTIVKPAKATELFKYLQRKHIGGTNNAKGNQFESFFTIFKIAHLWYEDPSNTFFSSQELCFIDDLVIHINKKEIQHYQIKDVKIISWKSGDHPLANDFAYQMNLYQKTKTRAKLHLVVSSKSLAKRLRNNRTKKLTSIVTVNHFPAAISINRLLTLSSVFRKALTKLCALNQPRTDKLEIIAAIILGQWDISDKSKVLLSHLIDQCLTSSPNFFKGGQNNISLQLDTLLKSVKGLTFTTINGTLQWNFNQGTDLGVLPYKIGSREFNQFENDLLNFSTGTTFQTIEHLFI